MWRDGSKPAMKVVASVHVRIGSERLPGKVLRPICGKPMLLHLIERVREAEKIDEIVVAFPASFQNDGIEDFCRDEGIQFFRGSEEDNLDRLAGALHAAGADIGVMVYGDNPLIDPCLIDEFVLFLMENPEYDWVGNNLKTTYPAGMEVEAFWSGVITEANQLAIDDSLREHATLFVRKNPNLYQLANLEAPKHHYRPDYYLGVDEEDDLIVVEAILSEFATKPRFSLGEVIEFLDKTPELAASNSGVFRRWKEHRASR